MTEQKYKFKAKDFYKLLEDQDFKCSVSSRELTPDNCTAVHKTPLKRGGVHCLDNIYLVIKEVTSLKRDLTDEELFFLSKDIYNNLNPTNNISNDAKK